MQTCIVISTKVTSQHAILNAHKAHAVSQLEGPNHAGG